MTSTPGIELTTPLLADPANAIPLLRLLHKFNGSRDDPLVVAERRDIMLHVWTKIENCEESMIAFLLGFEEEKSTQRAA